MGVEPRHNYLYTIPGLQSLRLVKVVTELVYCIVDLEYDSKGPFHCHCSSETAYKMALRDNHPGEAVETSSSRCLRPSTPIRGTYSYWKETTRRQIRRRLRR